MKSLRWCLGCLAVVLLAALSGCKREDKVVDPPPDPNAWFHARVEIASPKVSVFVGDAAQPCLVVEQLSDRKKGLVGLWVGNNSGGDFANLTIVPA